MRDMVNERIIQLGIAQECIVEAADIMDQLDHSKLMIEKNAYESMNATDKALNLSKEGLILVNQLKSICNTYLEKPLEADQITMVNLLKSLDGLLTNIKNTASKEMSAIHTIEKEVAFHGELTEKLRNKFNMISESIYQAAACAELMLAMEM